MNAQNLVAWLPFDTSTTQDLCGGSWTASGSPTIQDGMLFLNGSSYLKRTEQFKFTGQLFTISCEFSGTSNPTGGNVCLWQMYIGDSNRFHLSISTSGILALWKDSDSTIYIKTSASVLDGQVHHAECDFDGSTWYLFLDGALIGTKAHTCTARDYTLYIGTNYSTGRKFTGTLDNFMIYDGVALHTENFTPPNKDKYVELLESMLISRHVKFEFTYDVSRYIDNLYSMFFDVKLQFVNTSYYPDIYQDNPTAGTNDGTAVSSGNDYSSPISVNLDASKSESKIVKLSIRATSQSSDTEISIFDNRNHLKLSKNAEGPFSDSLTFDSLNGDNQIFYVQANSNIDELPSFKNDTKLITNSRVVYNTKSLLTFDDSTINDQAGVVWQANNGSVNIINGELQFDGNFYLSTNNIILGGNDFVIEGYFTISSSSGSYCRIFSLHNNMQTTNNCINFARYGNSAQMYTDCMGQTSSRFDVTLDTNHNFIYKYSQNLGQITIFIDNELKLTWNKQIPKTTFNNLWLGRSNYSADAMLKGTIGEFRIFEGSISQQTSNISLDIVNPVATDNYSASNDITVWLPFTHSPTEDYCGNSWKILTGQIVRIDLDPDDHSPCVYIETKGSHYGTAMQLDCAGMYIGGKDFSVEFDLWYGGGMPFSDRSVFQFGSSKLGNIGVVVQERFSKNWQQTHLHVFGQNTPLRSLDYRQWWHVTVSYSHSSSQISLRISDKDEEYTDTLNVNIPRTFFPFVGIQVPGMDDVANCFMRNFIIRGGETVPTCGSTIQLCVRYNNEVLTYPLRNYDFCSLPAFCVRYNGRSWYNILREVNDPLASNFYILHNDKMYALSK